MKRNNLILNGISLNVTNYGGEGEEILLLHGAMGRGTCWWPVAHELVQNGYRVIALDQRGHGNSGKAYSYEIDDFVSDAAAFIEGEIGHSVNVVGHSLGGLVAIRLASRYKQLVKRLVVEDISANGNRTNVDEYKEWFSTWPVPFSSMHDIQVFFKNVRPGLEGYFQEVFYEKEGGYFPMFAFADVIKAIESMSRQLFWEDIEEVICPSIVIKGEKSEYPKEDLMLMAKKFRNGKYYEVKGAYHVVHNDSPFEWLNCVLGFLQIMKNKQDETSDKSIDFTEIKEKVLENCSNETNLNSCYSKYDKCENLNCQSPFLMDILDTGHGSRKSE
ncbi:MAG: alpha/beta fold hydrolase [Ruminiclostridium sp.]